MVRRIEFIGQPSIFDDPRVIHGKITGRIGPGELKILRTAAKKRLYRSNSMIREMDPQYIPGLSKIYRFGPTDEEFIQNVSDGDWKVIQESGEGPQFRDVTNGVPDTLFPIQIPPSDIQVMEERDFPSLRALLEATPDLRGR